MARWNSCNVLQSGRDLRQLWQFSAGGGGRFNLQKEEAKLLTEPLPSKVVGKDWQTLFRPRLNIALLSADKVFLRVVQLPRSNAAETISMVELQLEKLSPLPTTQIVWGFELLPQPPNPLALGGDMQTAIVIMAARSHVEEFLGQLEGQGYLADRLELPFLDELQATKIQSSGVWIYPGVGGNPFSCLAAWWYDGILHNLSLIHLTADEQRGAMLQHQLTQLNWAGELEGWLTAAPRYHIVADDATAGQWRALFREDQVIETVAPLPPREVAALTARRAAANGLHTNLLPPDYVARYRQQFIDRLWMRALAAVVMLYVLVVLVYYGCYQGANYKYNSVLDEMATAGIRFTNTVQLGDKVRILQDQLDLQFAALDCWKSAADFMPSELTLDSMNFERGRKLGLFGSAPADQISKECSTTDELYTLLMGEAQGYYESREEELGEDATVNMGDTLAGEMAYQRGCAYA